MLTLEQAPPRVPSVPYAPVPQCQAAIVTGASSGIGRAVAIAFGRAGASMVVNYVGNGGDSAGEVVREIEATGARAIAVQADVSNKQEVQALFSTAVSAFGTMVRGQRVMWAPPTSPAGALHEALPQSRSG